MAAPAPTTDARPASTSSEPSSTRPARSALLRTPPSRHATDDEILGLGEHAQAAAVKRGSASDRRSTTSSDSAPNENSVVANGDISSSTEAPSSVRASGHGSAVPLRDLADSDAVPAAASLHANDATLAAAVAEPEHLRAALDANPELRAAWQEANAYRETFATPEVARAATASLADLDRMDALFFSRRPEDHSELARAVAKLDPAAFASLAQAMAQLANLNSPGAGARAGATASPSVQNRQQDAGAAQPTSHESQVTNHGPRATNRDESVGQAPTREQTQFFHATNAATVEGVLAAIESQVERLLPEGVSKTARNRVVGEIYRELDNTLRSNRALGQQMRNAFRTGALDGDHQNAIVSLVTGRARQALPGVAKRVMNEWTSTVVSANQQRRERQRTAERRVDIAGSGGAASDGRRSIGPRDIDYARLSDADILNL